MLDLALNIVTSNNYHTYNSFIKFYYFSRLVMMSSFHLAATKPPCYFAMFSTFFALLQRIAFRYQYNFHFWLNQFALICTHCISKSQVSSYNSALIRKRVNYDGNWPMILMGLAFRRKKISILNVFWFPSAQSLHLYCLNELLAP